MRLQPGRRRFPCGTRSRVGRSIYAGINLSSSHSSDDKKLIAAAATRIFSRYPQI